MKIIEERETQKQTNKQTKKTKTKRSKGLVQVIVKVWELDGFVAYLS